MFTSPKPRILKFIFECLACITWSIEILFCIIIFHASAMFDTVNDQIQAILEGNNLDTSSQLETWRQNHVLVCQLVDNINSCFGIMLLTSIGCYFIGFMLLPFELYVYWSQYLNGKGPPFSVVCHFIVVIIRNAIHLVLLIVVPYQMREKVSKL